MKFTRRKGTSSLAIIPIIVGILVVGLILIALIYWYLRIHKRVPSSGMPPEPFSICEANSDCVHIIARDESGSPQIQPLEYQTCINKNYYKEGSWIGQSSKIIEKTGKDLCECKQVEIAVVEKLEKFNVCEVKMH